MGYEPVDDDDGPVGRGFGGVGVLTRNHPGFLVLLGLMGRMGGREAVENFLESAAEEFAHRALGGVGVAREHRFAKRLVPLE